MTVWHFHEKFTVRIILQTWANSSEKYEVIIKICGKSSGKYEVIVKTKQIFAQLSSIKDINFMFSSKKLPVKSLVITGIITLGTLGTFTPIKVLAQTTFVKVGTAKTFSCTDSEATIKNTKLAAGISNGTTSFYVGYQQVSSTNKNPIMIRFDKGVKKWCRTDYETTGDDGSGYGLIWDGNSNLYGVFSSTGTQTGNNFGRFATSGWLTNYGMGGGPKVSILAKIDPVNGNVNKATFIIAKKSSDNKTNTLNITGLSFSGTSVKINADAYWSPLRSNKTIMTCTGSSPFKYTATFSPDLSTVSATSVTATSTTGSCN
jgi:hypothetical protein